MREGDKSMERKIRRGRWHEVREGDKSMERKIRGGR